jgi:formylmethanofuran dehydrogenase subunit E
MGMKGVLLNLDENTYEIARQRVKGSFSQAIRDYVSALASGSDSRQNTITLQKLELELDIELKKFSEIQAKVNNLTNQINAMKEKQQQQQLEIIKKEEEKIAKAGKCKLCGNEILDQAIHIRDGVKICKACFYSDSAGVAELRGGDNAETA